MIGDPVFNPATKGYEYQFGVTHDDLRVFSSINVGEEVRTRVLDTHEAKVREALMEMGWLPPSRDTTVSGAEQFRQCLALAVTMYTPEELRRWIVAEQPMLDNLTPVDLLAAGRIGELLNILQAMDAGAYL